LQTARGLFPRNPDQGPDCLRFPFPFFVQHLSTPCFLIQLHARALLVVLCCSLVNPPQPTPGTPFSLFFYRFFAGKIWVRTSPSLPSRVNVFFHSSQLPPGSPARTVNSRWVRLVNPALRPRMISMGGGPVPLTLPKNFCQPVHVCLSLSLDCLRSGLKLAA